LAKILSLDTHRHPRNTAEFFSAAGTDLVALAGANGDDRKHSSFRDGAVGHGGAV